MANGSLACAPSAESESGGSLSPKHCQEFGVTVKTHPGPHGPKRCLTKIIDALSEKVVVLVKEGKHHEEELRQQEQMHLKRH